MYSVTAINDGARVVIHDPTTSQVKLDEAVISRERNKFDSLKFTIYPDNPGWDMLRPFATTVEVVDHITGRTVFDGRVLMPVPEMDEDGAVSKTVTCEGVSAYLCDSFTPYEEERHWPDEGDVSGLRSYISHLLDIHNGSVEEHKRIRAGEITLKTFGTTGSVTKGVSRGTTWGNIEDKLLKVFGGEIRVRRGGDGLLYLDYAERLGKTRATRIEVARNMVSGSSEINPENVITRLYPHGAKLKQTVTDDSGNTSEVETEQRVGIESVNDGVSYIDDAVAIKQYGVIEGFELWDDVTQPENLLTKAREWLGHNNAMPVSHSFSAYDLSTLGIDPDGFELLDSYPCYNPLIGIDDTLEIVRQSINITSPEESTFDMGKTAYMLTSDIVSNDQLQSQIEQLKSDTKTQVVNVGNAVKDNSASFQIEADRIVQTVSQQIQDANQNIQDVAEMVQGWDGWEFNFEQIRQSVDELGTAYGTQLKYIHFKDAEIWLGKEPEPTENDFKVVIGNERIRFLQNNVEVAYISNSRLYITDARVTNRLEIGNFAFFPRENGNMTLRYIGGA